MGSCSNCGNKLNKSDKFCTKCGFEQEKIEEKEEIIEEDDISERKTVYEGKIHKCPNCGETIDSFVINCPSCGYEFRDSKSANSVREFALKLEKIESSRENHKSNSLIGKLYGSDGNLSQTDERKISLIRSFIIPNNKEDIYEFMILASSNIDVKLYGLGNQGIMSTSRREVSDAWLAKFDQAYLKAKISFSKSDDFVMIENIYSEIKSKIKREKNKLILLIIVPILAVLILSILLYFLTL